jgi:hypothetical protein
METQNLPARQVKYVLDKALGEVGRKNRARDANAADYDDAFNAYIDMLVEFDNRGITTGLNIPENQNSPLGYAMPHNDLVSLLTVRISNMFYWSLTPQQVARADSAESDLYARTPVPKMASNRLPDAYRSTYGYYHCGSDEVDDSICITTEDATEVIL